MDKVQVDARKLQLLNDRINQTIDALNQLRLTTQQVGFGLGHTSAPFGYPQQMVPGIGVSPISPYASPIGPYGFQHTSLVDPVLAARQAEIAAIYGARPFASPFLSPVLGGLAHSPFGRVPSAELVWGAVDPVARQMELARANEANRAWELAQIGLMHSTIPTTLQSIQAQAMANPFTVSVIPGAQPIV